MAVLQTSGATTSHENSNKFLFSLPAICVVNFMCLSSLVKNLFLLHGKYR